MRTRYPASARLNRGSQMTLHMVTQVAARTEGLLGLLRGELRRRQALCIEHALPFEQADQLVGAQGGCGCGGDIMTADVERLSSRRVPNRSQDDDRPIIEPLPDRIRIVTKLPVATRSRAPAIGEFGKPIDRSASSSTRVAPTASLTH